MSTTSPAGVLARIAPALELDLPVTVVAEGAAVDADALAVPVTSDGPVPSVLGVDLPALERAGFTPQIGKAIAFPSSSAPVLVAVGAGEAGALGASELRDAAAVFARAVPTDARLAARVPVTPELGARDAAAAIVEGAVLARYRYSMRSEPDGPVPLAALVLVAPDGAVEEVRAGRPAHRHAAG